jgi:Reverse transcriptase (RNA-dependent DNA polymerase)
MTFLSTESLEFAKAHVIAFYDSDFFPKPVEFDALWSCWDDVKKYLLKDPVKNHAVWAPRAFAAPKAGQGYRVVHQLHPLNAITYTALGYMVADAVESARSAPDVACSYRIELLNGGFFKAGNGYASFVSRCEVLASTHAFVLVGDVSDFYNRIYLHRLNNAIVHCDSSLVGVADSLEHFLLRLNDKASQGIPVGPAASIIFAEAVCNDIDEFIASRGFVHTRYVDDLRIFANSESDLRALLEELVLYMFGSHRLQFAWQKTAVLETQTFATRYLTTPERLEQAELLGVVRELSEYPDLVSDEEARKLADEALMPEVSLGGTVDSTTSLLAKLRAAVANRDREARATIRTEGFARMLVKSLADDRLDVGLARRVLRRARALSVCGLGTLALGRLDRLAPVSPDVFLYLQRVLELEATEELVVAARSALKHPVLAHSALVRHWFEWWLSGTEAMLSDPSIKSHVLSRAAFENQARAAVTLGNLAWVRNAKAKFSNLGSWDRRAVLLAAQVMPLDERKPWLRSVQLHGDDPSEKWIADWTVSK